MEQRLVKILKIMFLLLGIIVVAICIIGVIADFIKTIL